LGLRYIKIGVLALLLSCAAYTNAQNQTPDLSYQSDLRALIDRIAENPTSLAAVEPLPVADLPVYQPVLDQAIAQTNAKNTEIEVDEEEDSVTLNFQNTDISALINTIAQITGRNFIVDPRVKGKITLVSGGKLRADQVYDIFLSVLNVHNFVAVPSGDVIKILPSNLVKQTPTPTVYGSTDSTNDAQVTQVFSLKHSSVQEMVPILRPLLPPTSHFAAHAATNTLIFTDTAANVQRVLEIIKRVDQPDRGSEVRVVFLEHASASEMANILTQLASNLTAVAVPGAEGAPATLVGQTKRVSIQADPAINALIIQSPDVEFQFLRAVIDQLDIPRPEGGDIHVVYLKYAKATDLVTVLNEVAQSQQAAAGAEGAAAPALATEVSVQADENTNALVIRAKREQFEELKAVIERLDLRRSQVFLEAIIAEVSTTKESQIGVEWEGVKTRGGGSDVSANTDFSDQSGGIRLGFINKFVRDITGEIVPDLSIVLRALRSDGNTNILSTPNLLTLDNETAEIVVGQEVPFLTGNFVSDASSGDGDNTGSGVVNPFQTIERRDVGLTLRLTPQINEGGAIQLEIEQESSSVSPTVVQGAADLITDRRSIDATVQVDDGQIIVLGGLIKDDFQDTIEWVPVIGKIPLLGALFRKKTKRAVKTNLMVFLKPKIIRTPEDLSAYTRDRYEYLQGTEANSLPDSRELIRDAKPPVLPTIPWEEGRR